MFKIGFSALNESIVVVLNFEDLFYKDRFDKIFRPIRCRSFIFKEQNSVDSENYSGFNIDCGYDCLIQIHSAR